MKALGKMEEDLIPGLKKKNKAELAAMTEWQRKRHAAGALLETLRKDWEGLTALQENGGGQSRAVISLKAKNRKTQADLVNALAELGEANENEWKAYKKKHTKEHDQEKLLKLKNQALVGQTLVNQMEDLKLKMSKDPPKDQQEARKKEQERRQKAREDIDQKIEEAKGPRATGAQDRSQRRQQRKNKREKKASQGGMGNNDIQLTVMSQEEEEARERIAEEYNAQDEILDMASKGLDELLVIAQDIGKVTKQQQILIDELDEQLSDCTNQLMGLNAKADKILKAQDSPVTGCLCKASLVMALLAFAGLAYFIIV